MVTPKCGLHAWSIGMTQGYVGSRVYDKRVSKLLATPHPQCNG